MNHRTIHFQHYMRDYNIDRACQVPWEIWRGNVALQDQSIHLSNIWMWSARLDRLPFLYLGCLYLDFHAVQHDLIATWTHKTHVNTRSKQGLSHGSLEWVNSSCTGVGRVLPLEGAVADCTLRSRLFLWIEQKGREGRGLTDIHVNPQVIHCAYSLTNIFND